ncbi:uncharacterized protein An16g04470 [Aspergillus niger]|uniref:Contig An16c0160, genomic contig n=2 Tax=Aspergillus niger TaxID=5061 RepID=A2R7R6_ASPNC|nr:uncharacterized protein An16g04470 [Aspergillus niger]CAK46864.1 unnamed protein product [Aspergillus niger]
MAAVSSCNYRHESGYVSRYIRALLLGVPDPIAVLYAYLPCFLAHYYSNYTVSIRKRYTSDPSIHPRYTRQPR